MNVKTFFIVFGAVFLAELGDKTQLATLLFASGRDASRTTVFIGAAAALVTATAIAVLAGGIITRYVEEKFLRYAAGAGFVIIGIWTLLRS